MTEPYHSNIRHFLESESTWQCVLCKATVDPRAVALHRKQCLVELRIREIIREELSAQGKKGNQHER